MTTIRLVVMLGNYVIASQPVAKLSLDRFVLVGGNRNRYHKKERGVSRCKATLQATRRRSVSRRIAPTTSRTIVLDDGEIRVVFGTTRLTP